MERELIRGVETLRCIEYIVDVCGLVGAGEAIGMMEMTVDRMYFMGIARDT